VIDTGRPIVQVAQEIGVGDALLGRWVEGRAGQASPAGTTD
jgi:transposase